MFIDPTDLILSTISALPFYRDITNWCSFSLMETLHTLVWLHFGPGAEFCDIHSLTHIMLDHLPWLQALCVAFGNQCSQHYRIPSCSSSPSCLSLATPCGASLSLVLPLPLAALFCSLSPSFSPPSRLSLLHTSSSFYLIPSALTFSHSLWLLFLVSLLSLHLCPHSWFSLVLPLLVRSQIFRNLKKLCSVS